MTTRDIIGGLLAAHVVVGAFLALPHVMFCGKLETAPPHHGTLCELLHKLKH